MIVDCVVLTLASRLQDFVTVTVNVDSVGFASYAGERQLQCIPAGRPMRLLYPPLLQIIASRLDRRRPQMPRGV